MIPSASTGRATLCVSLCKHVYGHARHEYRLEAHLAVVQSSDDSLDGAVVFDRHDTVVEPGLADGTHAPQGGSIAATTAPPPRGLVDREGVAVSARPVLLFIHEAADFGCDADRASEPCEAGALDSVSSRLRSVLDLELLDVQWHLYAMSPQQLREQAVAARILAERACTATGSC